MMEAIRKGASSTIVKIVIIAPLVLAFAIWGIEDMIRGSTVGSLAKVGSEEITAEEFRNTYNVRLNALSRRLRTRLTPQQSQAFGLPKSVLDQLIAAKAVDQEAQKLGLAISQDALVRDIQRDPYFHDSSGQFSQALLVQALRQVGMSEAQFLEQRRRDTLRSQITSSLTTSAVVPDSLVALTNAYRNEQRKVRYFTVQRDDPAELEAPSDETLKAYYEERETQFRTPELRHVSLLQITADAVKKTMDIPIAEQKQLYEVQKNKYQTPEQRRVQQIPFETIEQAQAARKQIESGKDFMDVAEAAGAKPGDVNLGLLTQSGMIDSTVAEAAFALEKDKVSDVVEGEFSTVLLRVTEIRPGDEKGFDDVKDQVREELAQQRLSTEVERLHDLVDEARLAGKSPAEIAKDLKLDFRDIAAVDRQGRDPDGTPIVTGPDAQSILNAAFEGLVGVESEVVQRSDGGYVWVDVLSITESKQQAYEEVKSEVLLAWREQQVSDALRETAKTLVERLNAGESIEAVAKSVAGASLGETEAFKRTSTPQGLPRAAVQRAFALGLEAAASTLVGDEVRVVYQVSEIIPADELDPAQRERITGELKREIENDVVEQYVGEVKAGMDVSVNDAELKRILGIE